MALTRLKNLKAREVSLVDRAANKRRFLITKEDRSMPDNILKSVLETDLENEAKVDDIFKAAGLSEEASSAVKGAMRLLTAYKDELPDDILATVGGLTGFDVAKAEDDKGKEDPEEVFMKKFTAKMTEKCEKCDRVKKCDGPKVPVRKADGTYDLSAVPEDMRPTVELIFKEHNEAVEKAARVEKELAEEQDRRERELYVAKARSYQNLPVQAEEFGEALRQIAKASPDAFGKLETVLKAADEGMKAVFKPAGSDAPKSGSAWDQIEVKASQLVQKDGKMTKAEAIDQVLKAEPQLYSQYLQEKRGQ